MYYRYTVQGEHKNKRRRWKNIEGDEMEKKKMGREEVFGKKNSLESNLCDNAPKSTGLDASTTKLPGSFGQITKEDDVKVQLSKTDRMSFRVPGSE